ncbi:MAG: S1 RNA-binding domain-containing protein [Candidatus Saccharibacteria bacterium]|nr:S1 RNA-binding domain-containing protein [Candidatus Saccharibacteria bacterium]
MAKATTMDELLAAEGDSVKQLTQGDSIVGTVLTIRKHEVLVDLGAHGIGLVPRREVGFYRNLNIGDEIAASIVDTELDNGYSLLSLRKAAKDRGWDEVIAKMESGDIIEVSPYDANRGGLLVEYDGVRGFLPVSQLSAEHYPRVGGSDKDEILQRLNILIGKNLTVRILDCDRKANKLIFSEKEAIKDGLAARFEKLTVGDTIKGVVTGVVDYGVFVNVEGIEGLVHISEISWERVNNPGDYVKVGQTIDAKIIAIDKDRLSLSIKQLSEDPWMTEVDQFKSGEKVEGTITRITPFGAFVQISPAVEALVHVSELGEGDDIDPEKVFTLNERKEFVVLDVEKESRKISLSLVNKAKSKAKPKAKK